MKQLFYKVFILQSSVFKLILLMTVGCGLWTGSLAQKSDQHITIKRGDYKEFTFKHSGNVTASDISFVVKLTKSFSSPRLIQKASDDTTEISTIYSSPYTYIKVKLLQSDTRDLTSLKYFYDIVADSTTIFDGELRINQDVQTPFDGTTPPTSGTRFYVAGTFIDTTVADGSVFVWDSTHQTLSAIGKDSLWQFLNGSDSIDAALLDYYNKTQTKNLIGDSTVINKKYSGSAYSSIDTIIFGGSSLTPFYNRGVVGQEDYALQGKFQLRKGLNILPDALYGYSNLNLYQGNSSQRGMSLINFQYYNSTKSRYEPLYQMGVDIAQPLSPDGLPGMFIFFNARDTSNIANDLFGAIGHTYYNGGWRYRGTFLINAMGLGGAVFNIATLQSVHPSSYSLLRLHRSKTDSLNKWVVFTQGASGTSTFEWSDSLSGGVTNSLTWYDRTTGAFSYLTGYGYKFVFTNRNNSLEIQGGSLQFRGGTLTTLPNRTNWASPTFAATMNNTSATVFGTNAGIKLFNSNNTVGNVYPIYNYNSAQVPNSGIHFVNIDQSYAGGIDFITKSAVGEYGVRGGFNQYGHFSLREITTGTSTTTNIAGGESKIYVKGDKLIISYNHSGTMKYRYIDLTGTDAVWNYSTTEP